MVLVAMHALCMVHALWSSDSAPGLGTHALLAATGLRAPRVGGYILFDDFALLSSVAMRLLNQPSDARFFDVEDLQASAAELTSARERFLEAVRHSAEPADEETEMAAADLLRQAVAIGGKLRRGLSALMVAYAAVWARAHRSGDFDNDFDDDDELGELDDFNGFDDDDEIDEVDDFDDDELDDDDPRVWALERMSENLELLIAAAGKTSEGRSADGQVKVIVDDRMRVIELDFDAHRLGDPGYKASVVEAVNAGISPVYGRRFSVAEALLPEPESLEDVPEVADDGEADKTAMGLFKALCAVEEIQQYLALVLSRISRGEGPGKLVEEVDLIEDVCLAGEESLRDHLPSAGGYHTLRPPMADLPGVKTGDLAGLESVAELFVEMDLDEQFELETHPGDGQHFRALVAVVAEELQRQDAQRKTQLSWLRRRRYMRARVAEVEQQTFEGRSDDGLVTARATGFVQLADVQLEPDRQAAPAAIKSAVIDAVNAALDTAAHRRGMAMMIVEG